MGAWGITVRQSGDGALGGAVVDQILVSLVGRHRGSIDDAASLLHVGQCRLDQIEERKYIVLEDKRELLVVEISRMLRRMNCMAWLLTRISNFPKQASVLSTQYFAKAGSFRSPLNSRQRPPSCCTRLAASSSASRSSS